MDAFEKEVSQGKVALNLFSMEEIMLPMKRLETEFGKPITELSPTDEIKEHTFEIIRHAETNDDKLLANGIEWWEARSMGSGAVQGVVDRWSN